MADFYDKIPILKKLITDYETDNSNSAITTDPETYIINRPIIIIHRYQYFSLSLIPFTDKDTDEKTIILREGLKKKISGIFH